MKRKSTKAVAAPVATAAAVEREPFPDPPAWYDPKEFSGHRKVDIQPHKINLRQVVEDLVWHLPPFQRGSVWTPGQQVAFCDSLWEGMPTAPLLVWRRYLPGAGYRSRHYVLDGQQRLTALGATVLRQTPEGEVANPATSAFFDPDAGRFTTVKAPWGGSVRDICTLGTEHRRGEPKDPDERRRWWWAYLAKTRLDSVEIIAYTIEHDTPVERVVRAFRTINRPGVAFDLDEIERLVSSIPAWEV